MRGSWKLGQAAGIGIFVHWTFLILIGWLVFEHVQGDGGLVDAVNSIVIVVGVFSCVVLHELGHALMAKRFGIRTRDITLLPIGGVARLERMPDDPGQELLVALAGPAVNVVIALLLVPVIIAATVTIVLVDSDQIGGWLQIGTTLLLGMLIINLFMVGFNLLPAFPMDGGRVLRALLAHWLSYVRATRIAAGIGQAVAILFVPLVIFAPPWLPFFQWPLLLIALFIYVAARQESHMVQVLSMLKGVPVYAATVTRFGTLAPDLPLEAAARELVAGSQRDFPVVDQDQIVGMLTRNDLLAALVERNPNLQVADVMRREFQTVDERESLSKAFHRIRGGESPTLPVLREGKMVGIITLDSVSEWVAIQSTLRRAVGNSAGRTV